MTRTSASVPRVIWASSVDLPTPEPAKMPSRWPLPSGTIVSSTRTPEVRGSSTRVRARACGVSLARSTNSSEASSGGPAVHRPAQARRAPGPSSASPTGTCSGMPVARTARAGVHAGELAERHAGQPLAGDGDHLGEQAAVR
jgi:hypothetical protein